MEHPISHPEFDEFNVSCSDRHRTVVQWSEYSLYALLLVQPVTGTGATLLTGAALFLWWIQPLVNEDKALSAAFHLAHEIGARALADSIAGHAAAALVPHFVLRDDALECMAPVIIPTRCKEGIKSPHSLSC